MNTLSKLIIPVLSICFEIMLKGDKYMKGTESKVD